MADEPTQPNSPPPNRRRSSFAGQTFADLFGASRPNMQRGSTSLENSPPSTSSSAQQVPGPITQAAQQAQQRRLSITTLGLSGSPNQTSPFNTFRGGRRGSIGSADSGSIDESAIAEDDAAPQPTSKGSPSSTPFGRRTSFGAKAMQERMRSFSGGGPSGDSPGSPGQNGTRSPPTTASSAGNAKAQNGTISSRDANAKGRGPSGEGFNWSDNLRTRAERGSIAGPVGFGAGATQHARAKSVATMEPPPAAPPKPKERPRPDHFQERILKGDFYMD